MTDAPSKVAQLDLSPDGGSSAVTVKLYDDGTLLMSQDGDNLIVLTLLQQRLLKRMLPNSLTGT